MCNFVSVPPAYIIYRSCVRTRMDAMHVYAATLNGSAQYLHVVDQLVCVITAYQIEMLNIYHTAIVHQTVKPL